jgi:hypothetical protein
MFKALINYLKLKPKNTESTKELPSSQPDKNTPEVKASPVQATSQPKKQVFPAKKSPSAKSAPNKKKK